MRPQRPAGVEGQHLEGVAVAHCDDRGAAIPLGGVEADERAQGAAEIAHVLGLPLRERIPDRFRVHCRFGMVLLEGDPGGADGPPGPCLEGVHRLRQTAGCMPILHCYQVERRHSRLREPGGGRGQGVGLVEDQHTGAYVAPDRVEHRHRVGLHHDAGRVPKLPAGVRKQPDPCTTR